MTTYDVNGDLTVRVRLGRGHLHISAGPSGQAEATVSAMDPTDPEAVEAAERAAIALEDGRLVVDASARDRRSPRLSVVIVVPVGSGLKVSAGDLDLDAVDPLGEVSLRLGNGTVRLGDCAGSVDVKAGNLDLDLGGARDLRVAAGNGRVAAGDVGSASLKAGNGSLSVASSTERVSARGGQIDLVIARTASGDVDFRAASGSATIGVAEGTDVHLDLVSAVGDVNCSLPVGQDAPASGAALSLRLHTGAGDLRVHRAGEDPPPPSERAGGIPDLGRIIEDAMASMKEHLKAGVPRGPRWNEAANIVREHMKGSAVLDDLRTGGPGWADRVDRTIRVSRDRLRTIYGEALPVDEPVSSEQRDELDRAGLDLDALLGLPVDGPYSYEQLLVLCQAGLKRVAKQVAQLPVDGPFSPGLLVALVQHGLDGILARLAEAHLDGPVSPDDLIEDFG